MHCYSKVEKKNMLVNLEEGIGNYVKKEKRIEGECDCLPSCTSIQYDAEISQADLNWKNVLKALKLNVSEIPG